MAELWDLRTWKHESTGGFLTSRSNPVLLDIDKMVGLYHGSPLGRASRQEHQVICLLVIVTRCNLYLRQNLGNQEARQTAVNILLNQVTERLKELKKAKPAVAMTPQSVEEHRARLIHSSPVPGGYRDTKPMHAERYILEALSKDHIPGERWVGEDPKSSLMQWYLNEVKPQTLNHHECLQWLDSKPWKPQTSIHYFDEQQRAGLQLVFNGTNLIFSYTGNRAHSIGLPPVDSFIFVISKDLKLYASENVKDEIHHSSFLAGEPVLAAGDLKINNGVLKEISNDSGHYHPDGALHFNALLFFQSNGLDLRSINSRYTTPSGVVEQNALTQIQELFEELDTQDRIQQAARAEADQIFPSSLDSMNYLPARSVDQGT